MLSRGAKPRISVTKPRKKVFFVEGERRYELDEIIGPVMTTIIRSRKLKAMVTLH